MSNSIDKKSKTEAATEKGVERTRNRKVFVPLTDIVETKDAILLTSEMPGVSESSVQVNLEKGVLTIDGQVEMQEPESHELLYAEFETGDYHRAFTLSEAIDQDKIAARVSDGVLRVTLPKAEIAKPRQISVTAG